MSGPFDIGDVDYTVPENCFALRQEMIDLRNQFLGQVFDAGIAVVLTHAIGLLGAFIVEKWPEHKEMMDRQS